MSVKEIFINISEEGSESCCFVSVVAVFRIHV